MGRRKMGITHRKLIYRTMKAEDTWEKELSSPGIRDTTSSEVYCALQGQTMHLEKHKLELELSMKQRSLSKSFGDAVCSVC